MEINSILKLTCNFALYEKYKNKFICRILDVVVHYMTEEECNEPKNISSYPVLINLKRDLTDHIKREKSMLKILLALFDSYEVLLCTGNKHKVINSRIDFKTICTQSLREEKSMTLHIPKLDLTIYSNFDMNMPFNFVNSEFTQQNIAIVEDLVSNNELVYLRS